MLAQETLQPPATSVVGAGGPEEEVAKVEVDAEVEVFEAVGMYDSTGGKAPQTQVLPLGPQMTEAWPRATTSMFP